MIGRWIVTSTCSEADLLRQITSNPAIFGGKPIIRNRRLSVELSLVCWPPATRRRSCCQATPGWNLTTFARAGPTPDTSSDTHELNRRSSSPRAREGSTRRMCARPLLGSGSIPYSIPNSEFEWSESLWDEP